MNPQRSICRAVCRAIGGGLNPILGGEINSILLGLPTWDANGKLIPGDWVDGRSSDLLVTAHDGSLVAIDGNHIPYKGARYVDIGNGNYDIYRTEVGGALLDPAPVIKQEPATTNMQPDSSTFTPWVRNVVSVVSNAIESPCQDVMAEKIYPYVYGAATQHYLSRQIDNPVIDQEYQVSVYAKAAGYDYIKIVPATGGFGYGKSAVINLSDGTVVSYAGIDEPEVESLPNGWYRIKLHLTAYSDAATRVYLYILEDAVTEIFMGDGVKGLYVWGVQVEPSSFVTPPVETDGAQASRDAVAINQPFSTSKFNQAEGSCVFVFTPLQYPHLVNAGLFNFDNTYRLLWDSGSNRFRLYDTTTGVFIVPYERTNGTAYIIAFTWSVANGQVLKYGELGGEWIDTLTDTYSGEFLADPTIIQLFKNHKLPFELNDLVVLNKEDWDWIEANY